MLRSNRKAETKVIEKWYFAFNYQLNEKIQQKVKDTFFPVGKEIFFCPFCKKSLVNKINVNS